MFLTDACDRKIRPRNSGDKRLLREACFNLGDAKVEKDIVTFNEEEDGDTLVEEVPQIERGTVFLRDTYRHVGFWYRNIRDKRIPREAFFDLGDVKVENVIVTFNEEKDEYTLVEEGPQIERGTMFHRDTCQREVHSRNICDKRFPREA